MPDKNHHLYYATLKDAITKHPDLKAVVTDLKPEIALKESLQGYIDQAKTLARGKFVERQETKRVASIFSTLLSPTISASSHYAINSLSIDQEVATTFFPSKSLTADTQQEKATVLANLKEDLQQIPYDANQLKNYTETLLNVLQKHTTTFPSGYGEVISFYDDVKMVAAIAVCLEQYATNGGAIEAEDALLFVGGSLSGIQDYIYDIISKNASKNLKGRSFYLQLQVDLLLQELLKALNLYQTNVVYASGGGFYLLASNTEQTRSTLAKVEEIFSQKLFDIHQTKLFLEMGCVPLNKSHLLAGEVHQAWKALDKVLGAKKQQKFRQQITADEIGYNYFFEPSELGGLQPRDIMTNEELENVVNLNNEIYIVDDTPLPERASLAQRKAGINLVTNYTNRQIKLGYELKNKDYSFLPFGANISSPTGKNALIISKYLTHAVQIKDLTQNGGFAFINRVNNTDFLNIPDLTPDAAHIYGFSLYGGNRYPLTDYIHKAQGKITRAKTFSELAGMKEPLVEYPESAPFIEPKFKRLGVLRMDVDNLGTTFIQAFNKEYHPAAPSTLAAYSTLSRSLDYFFKGWLNVIWKSNDYFKENTQIIYSGGDDLFIVGRWDAIIDFAKKIHLDFTRWVCANPKLTLSGGVHLATAKYPIVKAADAAKYAEDKAKNHTYGDIEKNAFTLFGYGLNWDYEFPLVEDLKNELVHFIEKENIPRALLSSISNFYEKSKNQIEKDDTQTWIWQISYTISRMKGRVRPEAAKIFLEELVNGIFTNRSTLITNWEKSASKHSFFTLLYVAARWAALELRKK